MPRLAYRSPRACFAAALLVLLPLGQAAAQQEALPRLQRAFVAGNAHALLAAAADRVEIALLGRGKLYSRAQATYVMQDFFREYPPEAFALQSESRTDGSWIAAGQYRCKQAERPFQVYLRLRLKEAQWELREIRIEEHLRE